MLPPEFQTERLVLRAPTLGDALSYQKHFGEYEVIRNLTHVVPWPYQDGEAKKYLESYILPNQGKDQWFWGLYLKENPVELIGGVFLWRECKPENRGFWLAQRLWGQGLMTEAVVPIMNFTFDCLRFEKLIFSNAVGNIASRRVKEKTGARLLRVEPFKFVDPSLTEHEIWELTKKEWMARQ